ncbi:MAG: LTA synthase family protein [Acidithiobacillus sp.]
MTEAIWPLALVLGGFASLALENLVHPRPRCLGRKLWTYMIHGGIWLLLFTFWLALVQRPIFAALLSLALWLTVVLVGNAKEATLREPFVFMDFEYFTDAIKHPRLYLPFLGLWRALGLVLLGIAVVAAAFWAEAPITVQMSTVYFLEYLGLSLLVVFILLWLGDRWSDAPSLCPQEDIRNMGFAPSLWQYGRAERQPIRLPKARPFGELPAIAADEALRPLSDAVASPPAHLVIVQSESFFDIRRLWPHIAPEPFAKLDSMRKSAYLSGQIHVPPWGANTIRTEFSLLTGWSPASLGIHQFQPYRFLARQRLPSIAWKLKAQGYRTLCIHPYWSNFYDRHVIYPLLGFDEFLDISAFNEADRSGPYIGDQAIAQKTLELLTQSEQPLFIFIITMENHGPLHLESITPEERRILLTQDPPVGADDLAIYLRHVAHAGDMLHALTTKMQTLSRPGVVAFYGDHVPIMENLYQNRNFNDGRTDYWLWSSRHEPAQSSHPEIRVENLGALAVDLLAMPEA